MIDIIELTISMQFEGFSVHVTDIFLEDQALDVGLKGFQLEIVLSFVVRQDWDCVIELEGVRVCSVINKNYL